jgi:hypothetical protein
MTQRTLIAVSYNKTLISINITIDLNVPLERSRLIFVEIEGLDSIHKVLSRKPFMLLANQIKKY